MRKNENSVVVLLIQLKSFVDDTYGCQQQLHKVGAGSSTVAARNGCCKWQTSV